MIRSCRSKSPSRAPAARPQASVLGVPARPRRSAPMVLAVAVAAAFAAVAAGGCSREPDIEALRIEFGKPRPLAMKARGNYRAMAEEAAALARRWHQDAEAYHIALAGVRAGKKLRVERAHFDYRTPPMEDPSQRKLPRTMRTKRVLKVRVAVDAETIRSEMLGYDFAAGDAGKALPKKARDAEWALAQIENICEVCKRQEGEIVLEGMFVSREGEAARGAFDGHFPSAPAQPELTGRSIWRFLKVTREGAIPGSYDGTEVSEYVTIDAETGKKL